MALDIVGLVIGYALSAFLLVLIARLVVDWAGLLTSGASWLPRARELTHAATEPVLAPVRNVLRPIRAGGVSIDVAFVVVFFLVLMARSLAFSL